MRTESSSTSSVLLRLTFLNYVLLGNFIIEHEHLDHIHSHFLVQCLPEQSPTTSQNISSPSSLPFSLSPPLPCSFSAQSKINSACTFIAIHPTTDHRDENTWLSHGYLFSWLRWKTHRTGPNQHFFLNPTQPRHSFCNSCWHYCEECKDLGNSPFVLYALRWHLHLVY